MAHCIPPESTPEIKEKRRQTMMAIVFERDRKGNPRVVDPPWKGKRLPKTCAEAIAKGSRYYNTGTPCVRGHYAPRQVGRYCVECKRIQSLEAMKKKHVRKMAQLVEVCHEADPLPYRTIVL